MHLSASHKPIPLPKRFPIGTTYVVEDRSGENGSLRVFSRYLVLPSGQRIDLVDDFGGSLADPAALRGHRRTRNRGRAQNRMKMKRASEPAKKIISQAGTRHQ